MRRTSVDSSVLAAIGYSAKDKTLEVEFRSGRVYRYYRVPRAEYESLMSARSAGKYFNIRIRDRYPARELT